MTRATNPDAEAELELAALEVFRRVGWEVVGCMDERFGAGGTVGRDHPGEVVLTRRLRPALERLNPQLPADAIDYAVEVLVRDRSAMGLGPANLEVYHLIRDGVDVEYRDEAGARVEDTVRVVAWDDAGANDFLVCNQFRVTSDIYNKRPDIVGFVNGLPLVLVELKAHTLPVKDAYDKNLRDYKDTIPGFFAYNAFVILSNGIDARVGSLTAEWEHFAQWKKIADEEEPGVVELETVVRGTCEPRRFLDLVENFTLFGDAGGAIGKILAKNHQYLGVNNAIRAIGELGENRGRLGVFWHTQGSGKSYSMIFFSQKVLRKVPGNWTFVIVTDRLDLDDQIYGNFARVGAVTEKEEVRAESGEHLRRLLGENHRHVFTLIQKFQAPEGAPYPVLSERRDIVVMTDEAHRTQYDTLALNMRRGLPNAAFLAFTGTPLIAGEERTRQVFGEYVSVYDFKQSVEDEATVPLYYENRIPELQLTNEELNEDMERLLEAAELDEAQERKLEREFSREYHLITRDDRLETVAADLVEHFMGCGHRGKAMVVCIDRVTAVGMYEKVRRHWFARIERLRRDSLAAPDELKGEIEAQIDYMRETDMAVVVSQAQNEVAEFRARGLDIRPHRERMVREDLETKFRDPKDRFRIAFVCSMWMTGFDAPAVSTIYLDKPMRNHTLMQAIARANRVHGEKRVGLIVDYAGVFRNLQEALAIYGSGRGGPEDGDGPIQDKAKLVEELRRLAAEMSTFLEAAGVNVDGFVTAAGLDRTRRLDEAAGALVHPEARRKQFLSGADVLGRLAKAVRPDPAIAELDPLLRAVSAISERIRVVTRGGATDISAILQEVEALLDRSVAAQPYRIKAPPTGSEDARYIDLSLLDFDKLRAHFARSNKRVEVEKLRTLIGANVLDMLAVNRTRMDFLERFQAMIEDYNAGALTVDLFFDKLMALGKSLADEERRAAREELSEEELAVFDLLTRPAPDLTAAERAKVKVVARELLRSLKDGKLVLDWRKRQQTRASVLVAIRDTLDRLPRAYAQPLYEQKCDVVYQHVFDAYPGAGHSRYSPAA